MAPESTGPVPLPVYLALLSSLIFIVFGISFWFSNCMLIFPDQGLYMHMAELFLQGKVPYVDMYDNNPPLAFYLDIPAVLLARFAHIPGPMAFSLSIYAMIVLSAIASSVILWRCRNRGALFVGMAAVMAFTCFNQHQLVDFGQREHIFIILYFPFFILRYLRWQNLHVDRRMAILIGIMAGVGIALKHYFLLIACAAELVWTIEKQTIRPFFKAEVWAGASIIFLYLVHFLFLPKAELDSFFKWIVPLYQAGYSYYTTSMSFNLNCWWRPDFYIMAATTLGALVLARASSFVMPIQAFSLMSALIYVLAGQIWSYHVAPVRLANDISIYIQAFLFAWLMPAFFRRGGLGPVYISLAIVAFTGCQCFFFYRDVTNNINQGDRFSLNQLGYSGFCPQTNIDSFSQDVISYTGAQDSILFISSAMAPGYPVYLQTGRKPGSRFLHAMILPMLDSLINDPERIDKAPFKARMQEILGWYADDIHKNRPKLIFVQIRFVYDLLAQRNFFRRQMANYRLLQEKDDFKVYLRVD